MTAIRTDGGVNGFWGREMGREVLDAYTQTKSVVTSI